MRHILRAGGFATLRLVRTAHGPLSDASLLGRPPGSWRVLTPEEIAALGALRGMGEAAARRGGRARAGGADGGADGGPGGGADGGPGGGADGGPGGGADCGAGADASGGVYSASDLARSAVPLVRARARVRSRARARARV